MKTSKSTKGGAKRYEEMREKWAGAEGMETDWNLAGEKSYLVQWNVDWSAGPCGGSHTIAMLFEDQLDMLGFLRFNIIPHMLHWGCGYGNSGEELEAEHYIKELEPEVRKIVKKLLKAIDDCILMARKIDNDEILGMLNTIGNSEPHFDYFTLSRVSDMLAPGGEIHKAYMKFQKSMPENSDMLEEAPEELLILMDPDVPRHSRTWKRALKRWLEPGEEEY